MSLSSPARCGRHSPPALIDDAMSEVFLRIPADDPKSFVRAAAVCTTWRRILCDLIFARQYRAFHGAPPMLGFLRNAFHEREDGHYVYVVSDFVSTGSFRSPACRERRNWRGLDSRHGLVLFHTPRVDGNFLVCRNFVVCDLVTCDQWRINASTELSNIIWPDQDDEEEDEDGVGAKGVTWNAAVLCAKDRCHHAYCHYGPFLVALVGSDKEHAITFASVYSSATRRWSDMIYIEEWNPIDMTGDIAVVGDKVYFQCADSATTLEYNIGEQEISVFEPPVEDEDLGLPNIHLMGVYAGMLLFATVLGPRLFLWSMEAGPNGTEEWARRRVIELGPLLPTPLLSSLSLVGFAEGAGIIFVSTEAGLYTLDLSSGQSNHVHKQVLLGKVLPYMSFYTRAWGRSLTSD